MESGKEGVFGRQNQDPLLCHRAVDVVVLYDHILLQHLDRVDLVRVSLSFGQHDLAEATLAQDLDEVEVADADLAHVVASTVSATAKTLVDAAMQRTGVLGLPLYLGRRLILIGSRLAVRAAVAYAGSAAGLERGPVVDAWRLELLVGRDTHRTEDIGHRLHVDAAVVGHVFLAAFVDIHVADCVERA